jgi:hypothetical protein
MAETLDLGLLMKQQKDILEGMNAMRADISGMREEMLVLTTIVMRQGRSAPEQLVSVRKLEEPG